MNVDRAHIVVGVDGTPSAGAALTWALEEARSLHCAVRLVNAYGDEYDSAAVQVYGRIPMPERARVKAAAETIVERARAEALESAPDVTVTTAAISEDPAQVLLDESHHAARIVLGSRGLKAFGSWALGSVGAAVAARAVCPVVVVRGPSGLLEERPAVVAGVEASNRSRHVLSFAFDYADRHRLPLKAVMCWHRDALTEMAWRPETPAPPRADEWLAEALAGWREEYPDVEVHPGVVREHAAAGLVAAAAAQHLLVVGSRGERAVVGTVLGSVSQAVLHHATCPVAVVPAP